MGYLLDAHLAMLANSRLVRGVERRIAGDRINAERAVQAEIGEIGESFAAMGDAYLAARIEDIRVVGARLVRNLTKTPYAAFQALPEGTVILAEELTPADTALLDPRRIAGFATVLGGAESHTAIMARALNLPAVLGVAGLLTGADAGSYRAHRRRRRRRHPQPAAGDGRALRRGARCAAARAAPPGAAAPVAGGDARRRRDRARKPISSCRASSTRRSPPARRGLGLVRTEFLYMNRDDLPDEDEQYKAYAELVRGMEGRPVTIRTLDIGGDKLAAPLNAVMRERRQQSGAGPARDPPVAQGAPPARHAARGDAARRGARAGAHPAADDLERRRGPSRARGDGRRSCAACAAAACGCPSRCRPWA